MHYNMEMASTVVELYFHFSNKARTSDAVIYTVMRVSGWH